MRNNVKLASGRRGWRGRMQEVYDSREQWLTYAEVYNLVDLYEVDPYKLWDENPMMEGSTNPADFTILKGS